MIHFRDRICFGISPSMLFPPSFDDELEHFAAVEICCRLPEYECFETFLPSDPGLRRKELKELKAHHKRLNYNTPGYFQLDGKYNPCSDKAEHRKFATDSMMMQIDYAAEANSPIVILTGAADKGDARRPQLLEWYMEFFLKSAERAASYGMTIAIEPIERGRFKNLILGPTGECASFILKAQALGAENARLMIDLAHLPLMEEELEPAIRNCMRAGLAHVHMGNAVLDPTSVFYGHTHPPIGVQKGMFDCEELTVQFTSLIRAGYIDLSPGSPRANISLEVRPYPGSSGETSAKLMYEKASAAFAAAALNFSEASAG